MYYVLLIIIAVLLFLLRKRIFGGIVGVITLVLVIGLTIFMLDFFWLGKTYKGDDRYKNVKILTRIPDNKLELDKLECISASELKETLNKDFYFPSTIKTPYLTYQEGEILINILNNATV